MDDRIDIDIYGEDGKKYTFSYDDNYYVFSSFFDGTLEDPKKMYAKFTKKRDSLRSMAMNRLLDRASCNYDDGVILRCRNVDGVCFDITVFDGEDGYISKRKKYYGISYDLEKERIDRMEYYKILDYVLRDYVLEIVNEKKRNVM